jgi:hypothetical protein
MFSAAVPNLRRYSLSRVNRTTIAKGMSLFSLAVDFTNSCRSLTPLRSSLLEVEEMYFEDDGSRCPMLPAGIASRCDPASSSGTELICSGSATNANEISGCASKIIIRAD